MRHDMKQSRDPNDGQERMAASLWLVWAGVMIVVAAIFAAIVRGC